MVNQPHSHGNIKDRILPLAELLLTGSFTIEELRKFGFGGITSKLLKSLFRKELRCEGQVKVQKKKSLSIVNPSQGQRKTIYSKPNMAIQRFGYSTGKTVLNKYTLRKPI